MDERTTLADMFRAAPVRQTLLVAVPVFVALGQLGNSAFGELPYALSVPFAIVLVGFSGLMTQYNLSRFRRETLERRWVGRP